MKVQSETHKCENNTDEHFEHETSDDFLLLKTVKGAVSHALTFLFLNESEAAAQNKLCKETNSQHESTIKPFVTNHEFKTGFFSRLHL